MACMEHVCKQCNNAWFNNFASAGDCPKCGSPDTHSFFDEPEEREEPERYPDEPSDDIPDEEDPFEDWDDEDYDEEEEE